MEVLGGVAAAISGFVVVMAFVQDWNYSELPLIIQWIDGNSSGTESLAQENTVSVFFVSAIAFMAGRVLRKTSFNLIDNN